MYYAFWLRAVAGMNPSVKTLRPVKTLRFPCRQICCLLRRLCLKTAVMIRPALLQNETHPYHQSGEMKDHIAQYGTVLESWFPLGGRGNTQTLFNDSTISAIANAHGVSPAQVIIRWHLQAGNICIPGSSNEQHIIEDYDVWDFELTEEEMAQMTALEKDERFADY